MSERTTTIQLDGAAGFTHHGRRSPAEMIAEYRRLAQRQLDEASAILAAPDEAFRVHTALGVHIQRDKKVLQPGSRQHPADPRCPGCAELAGGEPS